MRKWEKCEATIAISIPRVEIANFTYLMGVKSSMKVSGLAKWRMLPINGSIQPIPSHWSSKTIRRNWFPIPFPTSWQDSWKVWKKSETSLRISIKAQPLRNKVTQPLHHCISNDFTKVNIWLGYLTVYDGEFRRNKVTQPLHHSITDFFLYIVEHFNF